jgi:hypothetical protein
MTDRLRREIAFEAARLLQVRQETDLNRARIAAARRVSKTWIKPRDLPSEVEIRQELLRLAEPRVNPVIGDAVDAESEHDNERFAVYRELLVPLEQVQQNRERHPEGDALYHSLQVFTLAREALPYDEEFLLAALLHDVGKAIDPRDHVRAGLAALEGWITERTAWLIEHHQEAQRIYDGTIGARARRRLWEADDHEELILLSRCDRKGRVPGAEVPELDEALDDIREVSAMYG